MKNTRKLFPIIAITVFVFAFTACDGNIENENENGNGKKNGGAYTVGTSLIQTRWAQGEPFINKTPVINGEKSRAGCVIIAFSQIMKYHEYPKGVLSGTIPEYLSGVTEGHTIPAIDLNSFEFDWQNMTNTYNANSTEAQIYAVATLIDVVGRAFRAHFSGSSGGAVTGRFIPPALIGFFGYDPSLEMIRRSDYNYDDWVTLLKNQIDQGLPVYYAGTTGNTIDHAFILDGYDENGQFHINWGWGGAGGFYSLNALNTSNGNFNYNHSAIINIKPGECVLEGNGTELSPYIISTARELAFVAAQVNAGNTAYNAANYKLKNDIILTMKDWWGIGHSQNPFRGVFDGNNKVIRGLSINSSHSIRGFFNNIVGGTVKNLGLENVNINAPGDAGGIAGLITSSLISNCYVTGIINVNTRVGGIVGRSNSSIVSNCYSTAVITGTGFLGGIVGLLDADNMIKNNAALNEQLSGETVRRVIGGWNSTDNTLDNIAFAGMIVNGNIITIGTANNLNGLDITSEQIRADGTLGGRFTTANGWTVDNGKLPGFGRALDLPLHLQ